MATRVGTDGQLYIGLKTTKVVHIKSGIIYNKLKEVSRIIEYEKKIKLNSDMKRAWQCDLIAVDDKSWCDSHTLSMDTFGSIVAKKEDFTWYEDDDKYEPESEL